MPTAPYGSWRSPITADLIVTSTVGVGIPQLAGDTTYWIESRPTEAGRSSGAGSYRSARAARIRP